MGKFPEANKVFFRQDLPDLWDFVGFCLSPRKAETPIHRWRTGTALPYLPGSTAFPLDEALTLLLPRS